MKTREFNLDNWTGETVVISYAVKQRSFEMYGYTWNLGSIDNVGDGQTFAVRLYGSDWNGAMTTLYVETDFNTPTLMEAAVIAAARYVANHV